MRRWKFRPDRGRTRGWLAAGVSAVLLTTLVQGAATSVAQADDMPHVPASERALAGHKAKVRPRAATGHPRLPKTSPEHTWPKEGSATVDLPGATGSRRTGMRRAGVLPVSLTAPTWAKKKISATASRKTATTTRKTAPAPLSGPVTVRMLSHTAARQVGVDGVLFSLKPAAATSGTSVGLRLDYSDFAQAFGGGSTARLRLVQLPLCALTTPRKAACSRQSPVAARNDEQAKTLTVQAATVSGAGTVLAATTGTSGDHGDYAASKLSPSATWQTDLSTGDFSWSYDMPVPSVPGDFQPSVGLSYASGSVDGRTSSTNNQSSWVGDGFSMWPGSVERSYKSCEDDGVSLGNGKSGDLCWSDDNVAISFNGHAGELIKADDGTWKIKGDDGTKVEHLTGSTRDNGDNDQEYWRVTTTDGTRYYFGYNKLPGWATGSPQTNSTWNTPVFGDDEGEPCHGATFADSWCQQAYEWNLDYAVDAHSNAIAYYYNKETNYYGRARTASNATVYDRGGSLDHIEYGLKSTAMFAKPLAKVDFTNTERCLPEPGVTCDASTIDDKSFYWYDTPWDLNCKSGADCYNASPTFWTRKRLAGVSTSVLKSDGSYAPVDSWALTHQWGMADIDYQLELASIQHTGKADTPEGAPDITLPKVTFGYDQRPNRLDIAGDDTAPFIKERISTVDDESGGQIDVNYSTPDCDAGNLPSPSSNTTRCFPQYFTKSGDANPSLQWFNKYVVDSVTQTDRTTHAPDMVTRYSYLGGAAWHYDDDDGLTKEKYKTWSTYRGYGHVRVQTGGQDPVGMKSQTDHYFLRGMNGDRTATDGVTKSVTVPDDNGGTITDVSAVEGQEYKTETYSGPSGKVLAKTVTTPWYHQTALRIRSWGTTSANLNGSASSRTWTSLDDGAGSKWRETYTSYEHEDVAGRITQVDDAGDTSTSTDNSCTRSTYAENTTAWILDLPARAETVSVGCSVTPNRAKDVVSDVRNAYDGQAYGAAPTQGDATHVSTLKSHDGTTATYLESGATFDSYGRQVTATDLTGNVTATGTTAPVRADRSDGRTTTTVYTPGTGFPTTVAVTTPPATAGNSATAQTSTTTMDPVSGKPVTVVDTNGKRTDTTYDALGRNLRVWLPNRSQANNDIPNYSFSYTISDNAPVVVATTTLAGTGTQTSYTLYDGFLRPRQTQTPGPGGGRLVSDTFYDERGLAAKTFAPYYNTGAPAAPLLVLDDALSVESQTWTTYDGVGRVVKTEQVAGNGTNSPSRVLATTLAAYDGDRVTVTPPNGTPATTTIADAQGHETELRQFHGSNPSGAYDTTTYDYNPAGQLSTVTDDPGNIWTYKYDQRGRVHTTTEPDKGTTTSEYDDRGLLLSTTDARQRKVSHVYDGLGRETESHDGDTSGPLLTKHVWDPSGFKGQLASTTRYVGGASGSAYTTSLSLYDTLYRPHRTTVTLPASEGALAGSYQSNVNYNADGTVQSTSYPAAGALTTETLTPTYDEVLRPKTLTGTGGVTYTTNTTYSFTGKPLQFTYQSGGKQVQVTDSYQWGTQQLQNSRVDRQDVPGVDKSSTYGYDQSGNITSISDVARDGTDDQCFSYDYLGRLTEAWAQGGTTCASTPSASVLGGPAPYWQSFTYDTTGNRTSDTQHDLSGDANKDVKRAYAYPAAKSPRPHGVTSVSVTGPGGPTQDSYSYDDIGDTQTRTVGGKKQTLIWDSEGHLSEVDVANASGGTDSTSYVYDADGNRLVEHTPTETHAYIGSTELTLTKGAATPTAERYYNLGGGNQAVRTDDNKLYFLVGDHQGTGELAINATTLAMQERRTTPFGALRGSQPGTWPGSKGFVGGTDDRATGLTHLGARDYDPATGRFLSTDPVLTPTDPQSLNAYGYADNDPVTSSDPTGRTRCDVDPSFCHPKSPPPAKEKKKKKSHPNPVLVTPHFAFDPATNDIKALTKAFWKAHGKQHDYRFGNSVMGWGGAEPELSEGIDQFGEEVSTWDQVCHDNKTLCTDEFASTVSSLHGEMDRAIDKESDTWHCTLWNCNYDKKVAEAVTGVLSPYSIKFMQDSVSRASGDGHSVFETARDLKNGDLKPEDLPTIRVVQLDDGVWTLDHRRLVSFQMAGIDSIPVEYVRKEMVAQEIGRKKTTETGGLTIDIKVSRKGAYVGTWTNPRGAAAAAAEEAGIGAAAEEAAELGTFEIRPPMIP
ncbi:RHS repeat domain-containing protein [Streptomyces rhizosphaerihabitans]|uniref:RHS repeat domain-containing protein n=1 Tax=Streptomyces rhizosphaerihabitans TaxID=1266770 RepID=UPI0021C17781|nr:RHS repeat-associated core domain-containing protein [Streptomyces rhizosphaerihabitans]MCT9006617.1 sugar-binding protein [Streptomyces rhizosphaerihabitans]